MRLEEKKENEKEEDEKEVERKWKKGITLQKKMEEITVVENWVSSHTH